MADITQVRDAYKNVLSKIETLEGEMKSTDKPTEEQVKKYDSLIAEGQDLGKQIDRYNMSAELKKHASESRGSSVAATFDRQVLPGEGELPGISSTPEGELYSIDGAYKSVGDEKLKSLKSGAYKDAFAEYIRCEGLKKPMKSESMKILNEGSDPSGGAWLPPDFRPELIKKMGAMATVRPNARVYTTGTDHITFPKVQYNGSTADDTYANLFTSGVRFSWRNSAGSTSDISEGTNPIAGQINIPVHLATAAIIVTREQLEDNSFDILGYINELGAEAYALGEEYAYTNGTGAGQPRGFLQHPSMSIAYSTYATVAGTTYWGNYLATGSTTIAWGSVTSGIIGVEAQLPPQYEPFAKWYGNKSTFAAIRSINAGTSTLPQWSLGDAYPNYANGMSPSLLGYGIAKNQFMPNVATSNKYLALGDMKGYYIIDRVGLSVEVFREVYGLRDQVVVYMRKRTGGDLVHYWRMKALTST